MKANELRIGNWIIEDETIYSYGINKTFRKICLNDFRVSDDNWSDLWDMFKPIPLTEEILLKCGFELFSSGSYCKNLITDSDAYLAFDLKYNNGFCWLNIKYGKVENTTKISCSYVHQLQNLYYALTNEELIVNL